MESLEGIIHYFILLTVLDRKTIQTIAMPVPDVPIYHLAKEDLLTITTKHPRRQIP